MVWMGQRGRWNSPETTAPRLPGVTLNHAKGWPFFTFFPVYYDNYQEFLVSGIALVEPFKARWIYSRNFRKCSGTRNLQNDKDRIK
jgi:hypothetical protein